MGARRTKSARMERIYELYKLLGMADDDIASEMGMMVSTVRDYLSEAKLRDLDAKKEKPKRSRGPIHHTSSGVTFG